MKKIILLLCLLLSVPVLSFAQKDKKAKEILDLASDTINKSGDMVIHFTIHIKETNQDNQSTSQSFEGMIALKDDKFHFDTPDMESWFDGKTQWVLQKDWDEVTVSEPTQDEVTALNPKTIFDLYKQGSSYKYLGEKTDIANRKVHEIELRPNDKTGDIKKVVLEISKKSNFPFKLHIVMTNGLENTIHISKYLIHAGLKDSKFSFDKNKYPQAEIIDLR